MPPAGGRSGGHGRGGRGHSRRRGGAAHGGEEGGAERWLVTYADMLTLLLVLFIVLFSISVVNTSKFISLKTSLASAFGSGQQSVLDGGNGLNDNSAEGQGQQLVMPGMPVAGPAATDEPQSNNAATVATKPVDYTTAVAKEVQNYKKIEQQINSALKAQGMSGAVKFAIDRRGLVITVVTNALVFPGNSATLLTEGQRLLAVIAPPLVVAPNMVEVDGYTNQEKVSTYPYPSGWELSSARASAVVRNLISRGVAESRLSAVGFSDQRPLYPASDPRSVTLNRRVEIVVLSSLPAAAGDQLQAAGNS
jgi:chemotaxis protein MotB